MSLSLLRGLSRGAAGRTRAVRLAGFGGGVALTLAADRPAAACDGSAPALLGVAGGFALAWMVKPSDHLQGYAEGRFLEAVKRGNGIKAKLAASDPASLEKITYNLERSTFLWQEGSEEAQNLELKVTAFFNILGALTDPFVTLDEDQGDVMGAGCLNVKRIKAAKQLLLAPMSEEKRYSLQHMTIANADCNLSKLAHQFATEIVENIDVFDTDGNGESRPSTQLLKSCHVVMCVSRRAQQLDATHLTLHCVRVVRCALGPRVMLCVHDHLSDPVRPQHFSATEHARAVCGHRRGRRRYNQQPGALQLHLDVHAVRARHARARRDDRKEV